MTRPDSRTSKLLILLDPLSSKINAEVLPWSYNNIAKSSTHNRQFRGIPIQGTFHVVEFLISKEHEDFFLQEARPKGKTLPVECPAVKHRTHSYIL